MTLTRKLLEIVRSDETQLWKLGRARDRLAPELAYHFIQPIISTIKKNTIVRAYK